MATQPNDHDACESGMLLAPLDEAQLWQWLEELDRVVRAQAWREREVVRFLVLRIIRLRKDTSPQAQRLFRGAAELDQAALTDALSAWVSEHLGSKPEPTEEDDPTSSYEFQQLCDNPSSRADQLHVLLLLLSPQDVSQAYARTFWRDYVEYFVQDGDPVPVVQTLRMVSPAVWKFLKQRLGAVRNRKAKRGVEAADVDRMLKKKRRVLHTKKADVLLKGVHPKCEPGAGIIPADAEQRFRSGKWPSLVEDVRALSIFLEEFDEVKAASGDPLRHDDTLAVIEGDFARFWDHNGDRFVESQVPRLCDDATSYDCKQLEHWHSLSCGFEVGKKWWFLKVKEVDQQLSRLQELLDRNPQRTVLPSNRSALLRTALHSTSAQELRDNFVTLSHSKLQLLLLDQVSASPAQDKRTLRVLLHGRPLSQAFPESDRAAVLRVAMAFAKVILESGNVPLALRSQPAALVGVGHLIDRGLTIDGRLLEELDAAIKTQRKVLHAKLQQMTTARKILEGSGEPQWADDNPPNIRFHSRRVSMPYVLQFLHSAARETTPFNADHPFLNHQKRPQSLIVSRQALQLKPTALGHAPPGPESVVLTDNFRVLLVPGAAGKFRLVKYPRAVPAAQAAVLERLKIMRWGAGDAELQRLLRTHAPA
ncbi:Uncharacterized protein SCF082_LOCUS24082 [Durusdinium trenchii]|uniref:Uncharacterized protein n=1 Tax=Durusdinium trenchii TaxID=1381693 RepID=A0ABP0LTW4_9DINO